RAGRGRSKGPAQLRARVWHAQAVLRLAEGNRRGAQAALQAGMRVIERYRMALGATELRAHASGHVSQLAQLGIHLAIEDRRAARVLEWAERWRAGALRLLPLPPPDDELLAAGLAQLRLVATELDEAALNGRPTARLIRRQTELEESVRRRARHATGSLTASLDRPPSARAVVEGLGDHALVEFVDDGGHLFAVVVAGGRTRLHRLATVDDVGRAVDGVRFSFRRLAHGRGSRASLAAAREAAAFGARRLDDLLLAPLASAVGERPLVVVPTSVLHAVPWAALPAGRGRPTTVAPSAAVWLRATHAAGVADGGDVVFVAGPDLPHALEEVTDLARRYRGARLLTGRRARCDEVRRSLNGASLAHIACHGRFRADNPMFSCLSLADGPLTVYDLERLERSPRTLVLSACDAGLSDVRPGDELMGLAASVLSVGTSSLVASVLPVADEATRQLMLAFHDLLLAGQTPASALATAQSRCHDGDFGTFAAAASFVCFGAGGDPLG
ncbi:MAG: CHAT domain-containing protein, partial [Actinomycetota bacterium]|nr:CHAT domain-containing protein [Actinomycetota bacterium]